jgi:hypothetical protein
MTTPGTISLAPRRTNTKAMRRRSAVGTLGAIFGGAAIIAIAATFPADAQVFTQPKNEPDRFRGQITEVTDGAIVLKTKAGPVRLALSGNVTVFSLTKANFSDVDFGTYVGAASVKLTEFSPIIRDSLSYLHRGFELHIVDESLRGIALGHTRWDLTPDSVMSHGWVDDREGHVLSIKYGPTEEEETDVDIASGVPVIKMALGSKDLIKPGANAFAGAQNGQAVFVMIGEGGLLPPM